MGGTRLRVGSTLSERRMRPAGTAGGAGCCDALCRSCRWSMVPGATAETLHEPGGLRKAASPDVGFV